MGEAGTALLRGGSVPALAAGVVGTAVSAAWGRTPLSPSRSARCSPSPRSRPARCC